jgi:hypothetical protein
MFDAKKFAATIACIASLMLVPAAFAQVAAGYAIQLGQTAGTAHQMPRLDPRGYGPQDWHAPSGGSSSASNQRGRHHQVRSDDDDDSAPESPDDRSAEWTQVK